MQGFHPVEPLERRTFLSGVDPAVVPIVWEGQETYARQGQWLVQFEGVSGPRAIQTDAVRQRLDAAGAGLLVARPLGSDGLFLVQAPPDWDTAALGQAMQVVSGVRFFEPDFVAIEPASIPDDPLFGQLWGLQDTGQPEIDIAFPGFQLPARAGVPDADIDIPEAWDIATGGHGNGHGRNQVVVGVIDTGVDYTHPDLAANMWHNPRELKGEPGVDDDGNGYVDDVYGYDFAGAGDGDPMDESASGHGTHVAGILGASGDNGIGISGVSQDVRIMALRFYPGGDESGHVAAAIEAINYATMMRRRGVNIRLTNNSWGSGVASTALRNAIAAAGDAGMLFVAAAQNFRRDIDVQPVYPASYDLPNIVSVAITTNQDARGAISNWGAKSVDLGAPGRNILSLGHNGGYQYLSGTSMSAAYVSGVAALGWRVRPNASYQQVRDAIFAGVDHIPAMAGITVTGGRLNAFNTLRLLEPEIESDELAATQPEASSTLATSAGAASGLLHGGEEPLL